MQSVNHPKWGAVFMMREKQQPPHVWKHFYNPEERWDSLVSTDIEPLRAEAQHLGCPPPPSRRQQDPRLPPLPTPCYRLLQQHHDTHYGPAYLRELGEPRTEWGQQHRDPPSLMCCTPRGVLVGVRCDFPRWVLTAFRPKLPIAVGPDADDTTYHQFAHEKWEGLLMRDDSAWTQGLLRALEQSEQSPLQRTVEAWRLVRAIGHARALASRVPEVAARLTAAEALWERHRPELSRLLSGKLRSESMLTGLAFALAQEDPDEAQVQLLSLADILVVCEVLGETAEIARIQDEVHRILAAWPPSLTGFERLARARLDTASPAVQPLWRSVEARATASAESPSESLGTRVKRLLVGTFSVARALPSVATASSGLDLGPPPVELYRQEELVFALTVDKDLRTVVVLVYGVEDGEVPRGTRDGVPLDFVQDEFGAWTVPAHPGAHVITTRREAVEFTLTP